MKVYVNWETRDVTNKKGIDKLVKERYDQIKDNKEMLHDWLYDNMTVVELFTEMEKDKELSTMHKRFESFAMETAKEQIEEEWSCEEVSD